MILFAALAAGAAYLVDTYFIVIALAIVAVMLTEGILWIGHINDITGISRMLIRCWQFISGFQTPNQMVHNHDSMNDPWWLFLIALVLAILLALLGLVCIVALPVGIVSTGIGALASLAMGESAPLKWGLAPLVTGVILIPVTGLMMRLLSVM